MCVPVISSLPCDSKHFLPCVFHDERQNSLKLCALLIENAGEKMYRKKRSAVISSSGHRPGTLQPPSFGLSCKSISLVRRALLLMPHILYFPVTLALLEAELTSLPPTNECCPFLYSAGWSAGLTEGAD